MVKPIRTFIVTPSLPLELERQRALVYILSWARSRPMMCPLSFT